MTTASHRRSMGPSSSVFESRRGEASPGAPWRPLRLAAKCQGNPKGGRLRPHARRRLRPLRALGAAVRGPAPRDRGPAARGAALLGVEPPEARRGGASWGCPVLVLYLRHAPGGARPRRARLRLVHRAARRPVRDLGRRSCSRATSRPRRARTRASSGRGASSPPSSARPAPPCCSSGPLLADEPRAPARRPHRRLLHLPRLEHRRLPDAARRPAALPRLPAGRAVHLDLPPRVRPGSSRRRSCSPSTSSGTGGRTPARRSRTLERDFYEVAAPAARGQGEPGRCSRDRAGRRAFLGAPWRELAMVACRRAVLRRAPTPSCARPTTSPSTRSSRWRRSSPASS